MSIRKFLTIGVVCLSSVMLQAQEPVRMEYFLDDDPGYGKGIVISNIQVDNNQLTFDVSTAAPGPHMLSVRSQGSNGQWSTTLSRPIFIDRLQDICYVEYFIDNDPGIGKGEAVALPDTYYKAHLNLNVEINTNGLAVGEHEFFVRALDVLGQWTNIMSRRFTIVKDGYEEPVVSNGDLSRIEYFFDTDPGYGNGFPLESPNTGENTYIMSFESLEEGVHVLSIRAQDDVGHWSQTLSRPLYAIKPVGEIVAVEYFFDSDPGEGNGVPINMPNDLSVTFTFEVPINDLSFGKHLFWVRAKNINGVWSVLKNTTIEVVKLSGINNIESATKLGEIYDFQGRQMTPEMLLRGNQPNRIYIIDGRKVLVKP